jgi:hypothetical protein
VANRKPSEADFNTDVAILLRRATGTKRVRDEDLISDPKLKKQFRDLKKRAANKKAA